MCHNESESEFLCLYLDDYCEVIEVEASEDEDQGSCSRASTSAKAGHKTTIAGAAKEAKKC